MNARTMPASMLKANWTRLAQASVWLTSIVFTFQAAPPRHTVALDVDTWIRMTQFVLAVLLGLAVGYVAQHRLAPGACRRVSAVLLVLGLASYFANMTASDHWTCTFDGRGPMIVGVTLTQSGQEYRRSHPQASCERTIQDFAGSNTTIWRASEISFRHSALVGLFLSTVLQLSLSAIFMLESMRPATRTRSRP
jgi:hypothetical protein